MMSIYIHISLFIIAILSSGNRGKGFYLWTKETIKIKRFFCSIVMSRIDTNGLGI